MPTHGFVTFCKLTLQNATFLGGYQGRVMTLKFERGQNFCTVHLTIEFHYPMFNYSEVIALTKKQTNSQVFD